MKNLLQRCIEFVLLHQVCFSSHKEESIMVKHMDKLTFPNMYKSDFLEILWLMKREGVKSKQLEKALHLLQSKQNVEGEWHLERQIYNLQTSVGALNKPNQFVTERAREVLAFYNELNFT